MPTSQETVIEKRRYIDLSGAVLPGAEFSHANFSHAVLAGINLVGANLTMSNLVGANLRNGVLQGASLAFADLTDCDLTGADLSGANLNKAMFIKAKLSMANLRNANMQGANFERAQNVTWHQLLDGRIDGQTFVPNYLDEKSLFETLDEFYDEIAWAEEYSGRLDDLWIDLDKIAESVSVHCFSGVLIQMAVHHEEIAPKQ